jgi:hypothetical protein
MTCLSLDDPIIRSILPFVVGLPVNPLILGIPVLLTQLHHLRRGCFAAGAGGPIFREAGRPRRGSKNPAGLHYG